MPDMNQMLDKAKDKILNHEDKKAQPGDNIERKADDFANQNIDNMAGQQGVPQGDDREINDAVDQKINSDIPGGN